ncbi:MAG TPA: hypothetical protein VM123_12705 [archaeon]|nr:hypothetical protein [archaeon]
MRFFAVTAIIFAFCASTLAAKDIEKKGSFGVVIHENFVKFNYVITYLGDSYKENFIAFRLDFEDNKGYDMPNEIKESETILKNIKNKSIQGKVERQSASSAVLLFPLNEDFTLSGKAKLYTVIIGYKLKKDFNI